MKHVFIMNGNLKPHPFEKTIQEIMKDYDYEIVYTQSPTDNITQRFKNDHVRIYSVGGDGLLNQVIQGMIGTNNELVVIPLGTGNDFHRCISDEKDCQKILQQSLHKQSYLIDTALINDRYYINTACFGLDSVIANNVHKGIKIPFIPESKSYIVSILREILKYHFRPIKIYSDNQLIYDNKMILCTINNGQYYGGGFCSTPKSKLDDGYLDILVVDKLPILKIPYMLILLLNKKLDKPKQVHRYKVKEVLVECNYSCNIDGEEILSDRYHIKINPHSIFLVY